MDPLDFSPWSWCWSALLSSLTLSKAHKIAFNAAHNQGWLVRRVGPSRKKDIQQFTRLLACWKRATSRGSLLTSGGQGHWVGKRAPSIQSVGWRRCRCHLRRATQVLVARVFCLYLVEVFRVVTRVTKPPRLCLQMLRRVRRTWTVWWSYESTKVLEVAALWVSNWPKNMCIIGPSQVKGRCRPDLGVGKGAEESKVLKNKHHEKRSLLP